MNTLATDTLMSNSKILAETMDRDSRVSTWFITYIDDVWREAGDAERGLDGIVEWLWNIVGRSGDLKLVNAIINAEICPTSGLLHFHICPTFVHDFKPLPSLEKIFGEEARIYPIAAKYVDTIRKYCSKDETRVGETRVIAWKRVVVKVVEKVLRRGVVKDVEREEEKYVEDEVEVDRLFVEYVGKWEGKIVARDGVANSLERASRLKIGLKNDREKEKAKEERRKIIAENRAKMKKIFKKKKGGEDEYRTLKEDVERFKEDLKRLESVGIGESIYGIGIESIDYEEEDEDPAEVDEWLAKAAEKRVAEKVVKREEDKTVEEKKAELEDRMYTLDPALAYFRLHTVEGRLLGINEQLNVIAEVIERCPFRAALFEGELERLYAERDELWREIDEKANLARKDLGLSPGPTRNYRTVVKKEEVEESKHE